MMIKVKIYYYTSARGENQIKKFLDSLSFKQQTKILRTFQLLEEYGLNPALPQIRKVIGTPFWEMRILGKDNLRVIFAALKNGDILILHAFSKKTQKTSQREIEVANRRYYEWLDK